VAQDTTTITLRTAVSPDAARRVAHISRYGGLVPGPGSHPEGSRPLVYGTGSRHQLDYVPGQRQRHGLPPGLAVQEWGSAHQPAVAGPAICTESSSVLVAFGGDLSYAH